MLCLALVTGRAWAAEFSGNAFVNDDGSLRVRQFTVHLHGVTWLPTIENCQTYERPPRCGPLATLALGRAIDGFVRCRIMTRRADGSVEAACRVSPSTFSPGRDLAAWLLSRGWVVAAPGAPSHYPALEQMARTHGVGLWGSPGALRP